jgi:hypothetical protein
LGAAAAADIAVQIQHCHCKLAWLGAVYKLRSSYLWLDPECYILGLHEMLRGIDTALHRAVTCFACGELLHKWRSTCWCGCAGMNAGAFLGSLLWNFFLGQSDRLPASLAPVSRPALFVTAGLLGSSPLQALPQWRQGWQQLACLHLPIEPVIGSPNGVDAEDWARPAQEEWLRPFVAWRAMLCSIHGYTVALYSAPQV